ncbi:ketopantoate reductase PanE/ApbA C terminal-domain-containing protein [Aspergillus pseudotamarii]|uniref:2-dehydropantoate 2-reductase n=1 Tax=Aspergillus pseudotamarii TaxID=132259 RepID=A0A5N6T1C1_ASPPS|nr:ketopantoate reductase PanE/ApbA C terminal-domain-containing protein [Aspergillus pseudotamarii]KAE8140180.1 ketopantoate reductase PanE/ApbA C terminal-domain-containing protein [Aspergillus pseudotamarii]
MANSSPIYILGLGSIGCFIAHSLRSLPDIPPITLLLHRESLRREFISTGQKISLQVGEDGDVDEQSDFNVEVLGSDTTPTSPIRCLIVTVKASMTVDAIRPIKGRLGPDSVICLFQNGLGQVEELNQQLFPNPATRPTYMFGIVRHGVYLKAAFQAVLAGRNGCVSVGFVDTDSLTISQPRNRFLVDTLLRSTTLNCEELDWTRLFRDQLFKLAANCVLNPLTALLDVRNGVIADMPQVRPLITRLLEEISTVFGRLPEIQSLSAHDPSCFSPASLEAVVMDTIRKTAGNSSSMREDVRKGRLTEIEYINGWIIKRGRELGVECVTNLSLTELILAKSSMSH